MYGTLYCSALLGSLFWGHRDINTAIYNKNNEKTTGMATCAQTTILQSIKELKQKSKLIRTNGEARSRYTNRKEETKAIRL